MLKDGSSFACLFTRCAPSPEVLSDSLVGTIGAVINEPLLGTFSGSAPPSPSSDAVGAGVVGGVVPGVPREALRDCDWERESGDAAYVR